jgi:hypothetical protein
MSEQEAIHHRRPEMVRVVVSHQQQFDVVKGRFSADQSVEQVRRGRSVLGVGGVEQSVDEDPVCPRGDQDAFVRDVHEREGVIGRRRRGQRQRAEQQRRRGHCPGSQPAGDAGFVCTDPTFVGHDTPHS